MNHVSKIIIIIIMIIIIIIIIKEKKCIKVNWWEGDGGESQRGRAGGEF